MLPRAMLGLKLYKACLGFHVGSVDCHRSIGSILWINWVGFLDFAVFCQHREHRPPNPEACFLKCTPPNPQTLYPYSEPSTLNHSASNLKHQSSIPQPSTPTQENRMLHSSRFDAQRIAMSLKAAKVRSRSSEIQGVRDSQAGLRLTSRSLGGKRHKVKVHSDRLP